MRYLGQEGSWRAATGFSRITIERLNLVVIKPTRLVVCRCATSRCRIATSTLIIHTIVIPPFLPVHHHCSSIQVNVISSCIPYCVEIREHLSKTSNRSSLPHRPWITRTSTTYYHREITDIRTNFSSSFFGTSTDNFAELGGYLLPEKLLRNSRNDHPTPDSTELPNCLATFDTQSIQTNIRVRGLLLSTSSIHTRPSFSTPRRGCGGGRRNYHTPYASSLGRLSPNPSGSNLQQPGFSPPFHIPCRIRRQAGYLSRAHRYRA